MTKEVRIELTKKEVKVKFYREIKSYVCGYMVDSGKLIRAVLEKLDLIDDFFEYLKTQTISDYKVNEIYKALIELNAKLRVTSSIFYGATNNNQVISLEAVLIRTFEDEKTENDDRTSVFYKEMASKELYKLVMGMLVDDLLN